MSGLGSSPGARFSKAPDTSRGAKLFLVYLYLKIKNCIRAKLLVWWEPSFIYSWICEYNSSVIVRFEILLWLYGPEKFPEVSRNGPLDGEIVLCSCARHFTVTVPVSIQVYKWVPANLTLGGVKSLHTETGISSGLMGHYWLVCRLFYIYLTALIETSSFLRQQLQKTRRQTNDLMTVLRLPIQEKSWLISSGYSWLARDVIIF